MAVFRLCLWVAVLFLSVLHSVSADYGIASIQYASGHSTREYCVTYDAHQHVLAHQLEYDTEYWPLADLLPSQLCEALSGEQVLQGQMAAMMRGNCTFTEKGLYTQRAGGMGAMVVSKTGLTTPYINSSVNLNIPVVLIDFKDFQHLKAHGEGPKATLYSPSPPQWDYNMLVIWLMATGTVAVGGYWSGLIGFKHHKREKRHQRRNGPNVYQNVNGSDSSDSDEEGEEEESCTITPPLVISWVIMIIAMLLLLFFFYNPIVYIVIALYCLGAWQGMHSTLLPVASMIIPCNERLPLLPVIQKRPTVVSVFVWLGCLAFVLVWFFYRKEPFSWILLDTLGICFCIHVLKIVRLPNFKTCVLLLSLLFVYDIFFVFVTPHFTKTGESVMVKVATGGESATEQIPVLLTVPRLCHSAFSVCNIYSMLGFGDILVPGLLVSFCHTYDLKVKSPRIYFIVSVLAYGVGLILTFIALSIMQMGQPALLYLVPCTVLSTLAVAAIRGEVVDLWTGGPVNDHHIL